MYVFSILCFVGLWSDNPSIATANTTPDNMRVYFAPSLSGPESDSLYVGNRPPLLPNPLTQLPLGSIAPRGWLLKQLELQRDGFVGHLPQLSPHVREDSGWLGLSGPAWEEAPYWLRGLADLGYILKDARLIRETQKWLEAVIKSQDESGYFGPSDGKAKMDAWPQMIMMSALRSHHEATGDPRIIPLLQRYFRYRHSMPEEKLYPYIWGVGEYNPQWWQQVRSVEELDSLYWLYNHTGEAWLLDLAEKIHRRGADWSSEIVSWHGVNIGQGFREPATFYQQSKDPKHLQSTLARYKKVYKLYGQVPGGMFGADENCRPGYADPRQAAETCSMVEMMHSLQSLLKITSDSTFADRCENIVYNSFPATMTPDLKGLHYLTAPNMVQLDCQSKSPGLDNEGPMLAYDPWLYRCCQHNVSMGWPNFAEHLWMATGDRGLAAMFYAPCMVTAKVGDGQEVTVTIETNYPFNEKITLILHTAQAVRFPLALRIPGWCSKPRIQINQSSPLTVTGSGGYVLIDRSWQDGDKIDIELPMEIVLKRWTGNHDSVSVNRGPLTYSLKIGERWERYNDSNAWPAYEVFPTTPWNYGLVIDPKNPTSHFKLIVQTAPLADQPFDLKNAPLEIQAQARRIPQWQMDSLGLVGILQPSPARVEEGPAETITLIPMGCARLRISAFPTVSTDDKAQEWKIPAPTQPASSSANHQ